ncbi:MAG: hypothetical protein HYV07_22435 [Deltaproteobacteria bacterium]|nr:hypothetical protein [Deltaproteobacteria bacterium]
MSERDTTPGAPEPRAVEAQKDSAPSRSPAPDPKRQAAAPAPAEAAPAPADAPPEAKRQVAPAPAEAAPDARAEVAKTGPIERIVVKSSGSATDARTSRTGPNERARSAVEAAREARALVGARPTGPSGFAIGVLMATALLAVTVVGARAYQRQRTRAAVANAIATLPATLRDVEEKRGGLTRSMLADTVADALTAAGAPTPADAVDVTWERLEITVEVNGETRMCRLTREPEGFAELPTAERSTLISSLATCSMPRWVVGYSARVDAGGRSLEAKRTFLVGHFADALVLGPEDEDYGDLIIDNTPRPPDEDDAREVSTPTPGALTAPEPDGLNAAEDARQGGEDQAPPRKNKNDGPNAAEDARKGGEDQRKNKNEEATLEANP